MENRRTGVIKTYKLFVGGKFPRTESGRYLTLEHPRSGKHLASYCQASRKDLRDSVVAARKAQPGWAATSSYLRGQILYRIAEMLESRSTSMASEISNCSGVSLTAAKTEIHATIDRILYYAGWADKYSQVFGSTNPVASSHFNFSTPEPTGIVGVICPDKPPLLALATLVAPAILSGNSTIVLASEKYPLPAITLAEVIANSDVPGGVINLLSGSRCELAPHFANHLDINAIIDGSGDSEITSILKKGSSTNLKRVTIRNMSATAWNGKAGRDPYFIMDSVELKTLWHPVGT
ncbi:MAG: aldehyde dehydrogenase [Verrucomicrobiaceae bacterium]|nr:aldehyde dehydrogenase [Verrucomicrobiaceae bacterium]